jgi:hypothetical protein
MTRQLRHVCVAVSLAMLAAGCTSTRHADASIFSVLPGIWGWEADGAGTCSANPHAITFSNDRSVMFLRTAKTFERHTGAETSVVLYRILDSDPHLRLALDGETRTTPTGALVEWDLIMLSLDRYCWHRTDWPAGSCTAAIVRCVSAASQ